MDFPRPMLARTVDDLPTAEHLVYEPKWDGFRALCSTSPPRIISKSGRNATRQWPELVEALRTLPDGLLLDGEIVRWDQGRLDFDALLRRNVAARMRALQLSREEPVHLILFDLLQHDGRDITRRSLAYRRARLEEVLAGVGTPHLVLGWQTDDVDVAREWFEGLAAAGIEGLVIKDTRRAYAPDRRGWDKYKRRVTTEAVVGGVIGSVHMPMSLILARWHEDLSKWMVAGRTTDLDGHQQAEIVDLLHKAGSEHPWGPTLSPAWGRQERIHYSRVRLELVVEIQPDTAVSHRRWRHVVRYIRPRPDLRPADVPTGLDLER